MSRKRKLIGIGVIASSALAATWALEFGLPGAGAGAAGGLLYDYHRRSVDDAYHRGRTGAPPAN